MDTKTAGMTQLSWIKGLIEAPQLLEASLSITGKFRERRLRARFFESGMVISLAFLPSVKKINELCLSIAGQPAACDDSIYLLKNTFWFCRRYEPEVTFSEMDILLKQQMVLTGLLEKEDAVDNRSYQLLDKLA